MLAKVVKGVSWYVTGLLISLPFALCTLFIMMSLLGPEQFGVLASGILFLLYARYFDYGVSQGLLKKGKDGSKYLTSALGVSLRMYGLYALLLVIVLLMGGIYSQFQDALLLLCGLLVVQQVWLLGKFYLKSTHRMKPVAIAILIATLALIPSSYMLITSMGIAGAFLALIVSFGLAIGYMNYAGVSFAHHSTHSTVKELVNEGIPHMLFALFAFMLLTIDKLVIGMSLGSTQLGYYMVGFFVVKYLLYIPKAIGYVLLPQLMAHQREKSAELYIHTTRLYSYCAPFLIGTLYIFLPEFISSFLPEFRPAIEPLKLLLIGSFFFSLAIIGTKYLYAHKQQKYLTMMQMLSLATLLALQIAVVYLGFGIEVCAAIALIVYVLYAKKVTLMSTTLIGIRNHTMFILRQYVPFFFMLALCVVLSFWDVMTDSLSEAILKTVVFIVIYGVFFVYMDKRLELLPNSLIKSGKKRNH